nr:ABC transporter ATP-binding protein [uncultured Mediterraneibacter sp.]
MIEVRNLVKKYGNHLAVDHLDFTIEEGHIYGFLGPNGAGKSTTMNIMTGYLGATEGRVLINGHDILKEPEEAKKHIGYLPEIPPLYTEMTVREYMEFAAELKRIPKNKREESINEVEKLVKIKDVESRLIKNLSKGYRQRVGLAQAVLGFPEIIILDEPSVGLDPKQIIEIRELIRKLAKKHTVILSSHILAEVREVCDYILIISKGKLVASDTPENLERLLGDAGMIEIETEAPAVRVREILKNVPGIESVSAKTGADGITYGQIQERKDADIRATIFNAFAENQTPLLKLNAAQSSLEDVFMELTQNEKAADDYAKKAHRSLVKKEQFKDADALKFEETEKILDEEEIKKEVYFEETEISSGELQFEDEEPVAKDVQFQNPDMERVTGEEEEHAGDL